MLADLLPAEWFQVADIWLWVIAAVSIAVLVVGADRAVTVAVRLAAALGMSKVIIGATVVSLGTTAPETFVSVTAAFSGKSGLALGNGVGSIICDTALIFGLCCCITRLPKNRFILNRHGWLQLGSGVLLAGVLGVLAWAAGGLQGVQIPRAVGVVFLGLLVGYLWISVRWARQHPETLRDGEEANHKPTSAGGVVANVGWLIVGLGLVILGANGLIGSASQLAVRYGVPQSILAVTLVAFGTSLPELATAIAAIVKGHPDLLVGNVIGADILNVLFVIGASSAAARLDVPPEFYYLHLPVMLVSLVLLRLYIFSDGDHFKRWHGIPLLGVFAAYYVLLITVAPRLLAQHN